MYIFCRAIYFQYKYQLSILIYIKAMFTHCSPLAFFSLTLFKTLPPNYLNADSKIYIISNTLKYSLVALIYMLLSCFIVLQQSLLEKEMATHSNILAQRIPRTEEPIGLVYGVVKGWIQLSNFHSHKTEATFCYERLVTMTFDNER